MPEERRVVTVLFADIVGSTAMGEMSDPEDVRALQSTYSRIARDVLSTHGGTVEKFIGDAVMAVFGVPQAHDDDPDRALTASLALRDSLARDPATNALSLRIGVNSGEVIAVRDAQSEMLVSGDTVNVAARIQQAAAPGEILVGERTIAGTRRRATFGDRRSLEVRGRSAPVAAAPLLSHEAGLARTEEPPFVGREADLAQLSLIAVRAFAEARPQLVTISAPAGTGKSRLVNVFTAHVRVLRPNLRVATAQVVPYGSGTYLPMRTLLASLMRLKESALDVGSLRRALSERGMPPAEAERFAGLVAETLGLSSQGVGHEREEFFAAWRTCVERFAADAPTILVLEDLHWATESLLDLIEHVTQQRARAPLMIVALTRPELFDRRGTWGTARRNATSIVLEPLAPGETKELLAAVMPEAPTLTLERMADRAEGNPFFAVELARSLRERGEGAGLPDTVQASVLARLDLLPQGERRALQLGSVIGRSFAPGALARVAGPDADRSLESLVDRDLLVPQLDGEYSFRHIVIREVAYGTLPRSERARAHLELARWLAGLADTPPEVVAYHYRQALSLSPRSLTDEDRAQAIAALETAGAFAKRTGADREAVALLRDAIQYAAGPDQVHLHERLGDALEITDDASDAYAEAFTRWQTLPNGDPRDGARLLRKRALVYARWAGSLRRRMDGPEIAALVAKARDLMGTRDPVESARLDLITLFFVGNATLRHEIAAERLPSRDAALALGEAARQVLAAAGDRDAESEALDALASVARTGGMVERSIRYSRERMELPGLSLLERSDAVAMVCNGLAYLGDFDGVLKTFSAHLTSLRPGEPEGFYAYPHTWAEWASRLSGRWDDALTVGDRVAAIVETHERSGTAPVAALTLTLAAYVARARLDRARFERYGAAAAPIVEGMTSDIPTVAVVGLVFRDDVAGALRNLEVERGRAALGRVEMLVVLLFDHDVVVDEAGIAGVEARADVHTPFVLARTALVRAVGEGAASLRRSIEELDAAGLRADAARARGLLARITRDAADREVAEEALRALGDRAYLARLDEPFEPHSG